MEQTVPMWAFVALLGVFQILLSAVIYRLWTSVDSNTEQLTLLRVSLPDRYVPRAEFKELHDYTRENVHELRNALHANDTELAEMRVAFENSLKP